MALGAEDYREGALCRLKDAQSLYDCSRWAGVIYMAGRAAEGMLRGLLWRDGQQQHVGHDLRDLLRRARAARLVGIDDPEMLNSINEVAIVWSNDLRFIGEGKLQTRLRGIGRTKLVAGRPVKGDPLKANALHILNACTAIVTRGDLLICRSKND